MTIKEVSSYLKLADRTILKMANMNQIPSVKIANQWRFMRSIIDDWLISRMKVLPGNDLLHLVSGPKELIQFEKIIQEKYVVMNLKAGSIEEILFELIKPLINEGHIEDEMDYLKKLLSREKLLSTGIGRGVAIPHLRNPGEQLVKQPAVVIGICRDGTDFNAIDGEKTYVFFLISTDSETLHVRIIAKLSRLFINGENIAKILDADSAQSVVDALLAIEKTLK
ncbi:MAG: PTS sugar transporter subunit IIA [Spirochaetales bacterium]|nr:PTS sugar transporter subunit IIA [Spirochaetales bacterium]